MIQTSANTTAEGGRTLIEGTIIASTLCPEPVMTVRCDDGWVEAGLEITGRLPKPLRMMACDGVALQGLHIKMRAELSPYRPDLFFWPKILSVKLLTTSL